MKRPVSPKAVLDGCHRSPGPALQTWSRRGSWAPAKLATWFGFRAGDRAHLCGLPKPELIGRRLGRCWHWQADTRRRRRARAPPRHRAVTQLRRAASQTTEDDDPKSLPVRISPDLDRACSIQRLAGTQGWTVFHPWSAFRLPSTPARGRGAAFAVRRRSPERRRAGLPVWDDFSCPVGCRALRRDRERREAPGMPGAWSPRASCSPGAKCHDIVDAADD